MQCVSRTIIRGMLVPCGQCMPCRFNRRRVWTHRLLLEAQLHEHSTFVTLTYDDAHLPLADNGMPTLVPRDLQLFMKRIRANYGRKLRFYGVGEYGDQSARPHYHLALFGYPVCEVGRTVMVREDPVPVCCDVCRLVWKSWAKGGVLLGTLTRDSSQYIAGYVTKKMTSATDYRLEGRHPEFARMSNRPGIGADYVPVVSDSLKVHNFHHLIDDVPTSLAHGGKLLPLGRYLRRKLRKALYGSEDSPPHVLEKLRQELLDLQTLTENDPNPNASFRERLRQKIDRHDIERRIYHKSLNQGSKNETL